MRLRIISKVRTDETTTIGQDPLGSDHQQVVVTKWKVRYHDGIAEREAVFFSDPTDDDLLSAAPVPLDAKPTNLQDRIELVVERAAEWNTLRIAAAEAATDGAFTAGERSRLNQATALARARLKAAL